MKSSANIYYDLNKTPFVFNFNDLLFYFSSQFNQERFIRGYQDFIGLEKIKMESKFKVKTNNIDDYFAIAYYKKIEKRGFLVYKDSKIISE